MNEDKLTLAGLRKLLAQKTQLTDGQAGEFLEALLAGIIQGLETDRQVRITGFGTFRLQWNAPRKSVDVNTGEAIILEGYNKVTFSPEPALRERISDVDSNVLPAAAAGIDPIAKLDEQAEEIKDLLTELGEKRHEQHNEQYNGQHNEQHNEQPAPVIPNIPEIPEKPENPETPEESEPVTQDIPVTPEKPENPEPPVTPEKPENPEPPVTPETPETPAPPAKKPYRPWLTIGITMCVFCLLLVAAYFLLKNRITEWADNLIQQNGNIESVTNDTASTDSNTLAWEETTPQPAVEETETETKTKIEPAPADAQPQPAASTLPQQRTYTKFIKKEVLTEGSRLTWLSRKYYNGAPEFWVYIYEANRNVITDPNNIPVGTTIRIPKLDKRLIDTTNPEAMRQAEELQKKYLGQ